MRVIPTAATVALGLLVPTLAHAQYVYGPPAATYVDPYAAYAYAGPPVVVAPAPVPAAPYVAPGYAYVPVPAEPVIVESTGRWCRIQPDGYHWCWTP